MHSSQKNKILIFGGYSHNNRGDHAMLAGMVKYLEETESSARLIVYSTDPEKMSYLSGTLIRWSPEVYFNLPARLSNLKAIWLIRAIVFSKGLWFILNCLIYRASGKSILRNSACLGFYNNLLEAKSLMLSGGGYLNSLWPLRELYPKAFVVAAARLARVPVAMRSLTLGPFTCHFDRAVAKFIFNHADIIGVRDRTESFKCLRELKVRSPRVIFTGDDSLLLPRISGQRLAEIIAREKIPANKRIIGVNLRNPSKYGTICREQPFDLLVDLMDKIAFLEDTHLVFVPISYNKGDDDRVSAEKIRAGMSFKKRATVISEYYNASEIKGILSTVYAAIGVSYHFLLFALSSNVPAVGLFSDEYYRRKNSGLFELYSMQDSCISLEKPEDIGSAVSLIQALGSNNEVVRGMLAKKNLELEALNRSSWT